MEDRNTVDVQHDGETIEVPTVFERSDLATWYGSVPDSIEVERIFRYDDVLRAEGVEDGDVIEIGYWSESGHSTASEQGWIAETVDVDPEEVREDAIGETLWVRGGDRA